MKYKYMKWVEALKIWNAQKGGAWCVPRKGSAEHAQVMKILRGEKLKASEASAVGMSGGGSSMDAEKARITSVAKGRISKEKIKSFLKKALEKAREKKKPFAVKFKEAKAKARMMEEEVGTGAGQDYLDDFIKKHSKEFDEMIETQEKEQYKFIHPEYVFEFGIEVGGLSGIYGLKGLVDTYYEKTKKVFTDLPKSQRETFARKVLKILFPEATRFDSLAISALATPLQEDGGISIKKTKSGTKSELIYRNIGYPMTNYLSLATKIALKN